MTNILFSCCPISLLLYSVYPIYYCSARLYYKVFGPYYVPKHSSEVHSIQEWRPKLKLNSWSESVFRWPHKNLKCDKNTWQNLLDSSFPSSRYLHNPRQPCVFSPVACRRKKMNLRSVLSRPGLSFGHFSGNLRLVDLPEF